MANLLLGVLLCCLAGTLAVPAPQSDASRNTYPFNFVTRAGWGARAATGSSRLATPIPDVIIHHTATDQCTTRTACINRMRSMQNDHMNPNTNGWSDIGYNFVVGGDGSVYEGRGWTNEGAHALGWNSRSVGIAVIGNFESALPHAYIRQLTLNLITRGVELGFISSNYRLLGHRQATPTLCPGTAFFNNIRTWPRFVANP